MIKYATGKYDNTFNIPKGVTAIGESAFEYCERLIRVNIPDGITTIRDKTFSGCCNLTSVTIPNSVTIICYDAFSSCSSLTDVDFGGSEKQWNKIELEYGNSYLRDATIHYSEDEPEKPEKASINLFNCIYDPGQISANIVFDYIKQDGVLYIAVYDSRMRLVSINEQPVKTDELHYEASIEADNYINYTVKAFLWDNNLQPLSSTASYQF